MTVKLLFQGLFKFTFGLALIGLLLFLPAGTFKYWNAWLFIAILFVPMLIVGVILMIRSPELLRKRLNAKEEESEQKVVLALSGAMFLAAFIVAGLSFRFGWLMLPKWAVILSAVIFMLGYIMYAEVMRENAYLSRTIEVQAGQKVVDTGLYGVIRHPMYSSTLILFLSMGGVLGSPISIAILLLYIPIIAKRIRNEEEILEKGLEGYTEYKKKVRYKTIPYIW
jgi:protein-S-isoprenylcysteine O-methyltransferase Ste14